MSSTRLKMIKTCEWCNTRYNPFYKDQKFCSLECKGKGNQSNESRICEFCKNKFVTKSYNHNRFCSKECSNKSPERAKRTKQFIQDKWDNDRERMLEAIKKRSNSEKWKSSPQFQTGENHPNYKGNRRERNVESSRYKYKKWRTSVLERDNFTCQQCNKRGGQLTAHHVKEWSAYPSLRYEIENGLTLCQKCHDETHGVKHVPKTRLCLQCNEPFRLTKNSRKFCSISCSAKHRAANKKRC